MTDATLDITGLEVCRGGRNIVSEVEMSLPGAAITGLVGPNGAGKSTVLAALAGAIPKRGSVTIAGHPLDRDAISYLPQSHAVHSALSVLEVMLLGNRDRLGWRVYSRDLAAAEQVLARFAITDLACRGMDTLSGGQQQIVLLAQRIMRRPKVLLLDEPTSALDLHHQLSVLAILRSYARQAGAVLLAAIHDLNLASRECDRIAVLNHGRLQHFGKPCEVLTPACIGAVYRVETERYHNAAGHELKCAGRTIAGLKASPGVSGHHRDETYARAFSRLAISRAK